MSIPHLKAALEQTHGVEAEHLESIPITESFQGETVWDGIVEVFRLKGHPKTDRAYAWWHDTGDPEKPRLVTVLHIHPATTPLSAVRAFIVQEFRNAQTA